MKYLFRLHAFFVHFSATFRQLVGALVAQNAAVGLHVRLKTAYFDQIEDMQLAQASSFSIPIWSSDLCASATNCAAP